MKNIIEIKGLNFNYDTKNIFNNFDLEIEDGTFLTIIGNTGSGKTTLVKILTGLEKVESKIKIDNLLLNEFNIDEIRKKISVIFDNPENNIIQDIVIDEISFTLENLNIEKKEINKRIDEVSKLLNIENILYKNINQLSGGEKQLVVLATTLITNPKILILDESFSMIDSVMKDKIYKLLKKINRENKTTIINITNDIEDSLYGKEILIMNNGKIIIQEDKKMIFNNDELLKKIDVEIPFMVELSKKLKYYNLVDNIIFDMDKMVNIIWK